MREILLHMKYSLLDFSNTSHECDANLKRSIRIFKLISLTRVKLFTLILPAIDESVFFFFILLSSTSNNNCMLIVSTELHYCHSFVFKEKKELVHSKQKKVLSSNIILLYVQLNSDF